MIPMRILTLTLWIFMSGRSAVRLLLSDMEFEFYFNCRL